MSVVCGVLPDLDANLPGSGYRDESRDPCYGGSYLLDDMATNQRDASGGPHPDPA